MIAQTGTLPESEAATFNIVVEIPLALSESMPVSPHTRANELWSHRVWYNILPEWPAQPRAAGPSRARAVEPPT